MRPSAASSFGTSSSTTKTPPRAHRVEQEEEGAGGVRDGAEEASARDQGQGDGETMLFAFNRRYQRAVEESAERQVSAMREVLYERNRELAEAETSKVDLGVELYRTQRLVKTIESDAKRATAERLQLESELLSNSERTYQLVSVPRRGAGGEGGRGGGRRKRKRVRATDLIHPTTGGGSRRSCEREEAGRNGAQRARP